MSGTVQTCSGNAKRVYLAVTSGMNLILPIEPTQANHQNSMVSAGTAGE
jgi:hypothetical protein